MSKKYVLEIRFDPVTDEVISLEEYIDNDTAKLIIEDNEIELDREISNYIIGTEIGIAQALPTP